MTATELSERVYRRGAFPPFKFAAKRALLFKFSYTYVNMRGNWLTRARLLCLSYVWALCGDVIGMCDLPAAFSPNWTHGRRYLRHHGALWCLQFPWRPVNRVLVPAKFPTSFTAGSFFLILVYLSILPSFSFLKLPRNC